MTVNENQRNHLTKEDSKELSATSGNRGRKDPLTKINIKGRSIKVTIDTGASINVIDEDTFSKLGKVQLSKSKVKAYTYGSRVPVKFHGKFETVIESKKSLTAGEIYVVKEKNSGCLLSLKTAEELGLISLHLDNVSIEPANKNDLKETAAHDDKELNSILKRYLRVFKGLGRFKGTKVK